MSRARLRFAGERHKSSKQASLPGRLADRISRIVALLDQVAALMQAEHSIDSSILTELKDVQRRTRLAISTTSSQPPLPTTAPIKWLDRSNKKESPPEFIWRVYALWMGKGLTRPYIRRLDGSLYTALSRYLWQGGELPPDFDLPTKKEVTDRRLEKLGYFSGDVSAEQREAVRLYHSARRRPSPKRHT